MQEARQIINANLIANDADLVMRLKSRATRDSAFSTLVNNYKARLYAHIRRMVVAHADTDDIMQETFIKAWRNIDNFREESSLYTWLYKISTNCCLTFLAKKKIELSRRSGVEISNLSGNITQESGFNANSLEWKLQLGIQSLPEKQRAVFNLRYYDEMPYEKMSEVLETSTGALKASYHIAAKKISEYISNH
jgi:RNA polymerase sigma factor (sigma-70 family)